MSGADIYTSAKGTYVLTVDDRTMSYTLTLR